MFYTLIVHNETLVIVSFLTLLKLFISNVGFGVLTTVIMKSTYLLGSARGGVVG
jgi:hypothetical protein